MTLKYELDLDIVKMSMCTKNELSSWTLLQARVQTGQRQTQTDRCV